MDLPGPGRPGPAWCAAAPGRNPAQRHRPGAARPFRRGRAVLLHPGPGYQRRPRTPPEVWDRSVDGRDLSPATIWAEGDVRTLTVDRCITGPIRTRQNGLIETLTVTDSVLQGLPSEPGPALTALRDADGMFAALKHHRDALSDWLASQLSAPSAAAVSGHADGDPVPCGRPAAHRRRPADRHRRRPGMERGPVRLLRRAPRPWQRRRPRQPGPPWPTSTVTCSPRPIPWPSPIRARRREGVVELPAAPCSAAPTCTGWSAASRSCTDVVAWRTPRTAACGSAPGPPERAAAPVRGGGDRRRGADVGLGGSASGATPRSRRRRTAPDPRTVAGTAAGHAPAVHPTGAENGSEIGAFCAGTGAAIKDAPCSSSAPNTCRPG